MGYAYIQGSLRIPRIINGLWQLAGGHDENVDIRSAANAMGPLISAGLNCFDMADHYGDAELVIGQHIASSSDTITAFTKWCPPEDGDKSFAKAEAAVNLALRRLGQKRIALMQYHVWDYTDDTYLYNLDHLRKFQVQDKIQHIGLTNVDAAHLELLISSGYQIATNQVSCSVIDRRVVRGRLGKICTDYDVGILAYGTLLGGFLSEKWLDQPEPTDQDNLNWSLRKYLRFIHAAGGWTAFQTVLKALSVIAKKHNVSIPAVATRYVLDIPAVSAVIVGTRLSESSNNYVERNLAVFSLKLDRYDIDVIRKAQENLTDIPGDCGDEYRRAPFLTAAGDLSHHLKPSEHILKIDEAIRKGLRVEYSSGSKWEAVAGYCRANRIGNSIRISGTTATSPIPSIPVLGGTSARAQTVAILDIIHRALKSLGSSLSDVVRTRIMIRHADLCKEVSEVHGSTFRSIGVRPANTLIIAGLIGDECLVEIEADAEVGANDAEVLRVANTYFVPTDSLQEILEVCVNTNDLAFASAYSEEGVAPRNYTLPRLSNPGFEASCGAFKLETLHVASALCAWTTIGYRSQLHSLGTVLNLKLLPSFVPKQYLDFSPLFERSLTLIRVLYAAEQAVISFTTFEPIELPELSTTKTPSRSTGDG